MRVVFMGTPDFAVPCLLRLIEDGHDVAGVFSQPDRPKGRGLRLENTPVKSAALGNGIPVFQPEKLRDGAAFLQIQELKPEIIVVVAYGRILPREILELALFGCVNVHASLLPRLRGAAPIQWSIINGDEQTGVTTMLMNEGLDTGDILLSIKTPIGDEETAGELYSRLSAIGADALSLTLERIVSGGVKPEKQDESLATYAPLIDKSLARLDFSKTPKEICNLIRGLNPAPCAFTSLEGKIVKVLSARPSPGYSGPSGTLLETKRMIVACKDGAVELLTVKPEGKKPMSGGEFARGKRFSGGERLE